MNDLLTNEKGKMMRQIMIVGFMAWFGFLSAGGCGCPCPDDCACGCSLEKVCSCVPEISETKDISTISLTAGCIGGMPILGLRGEDENCGWYRYGEWLPDEPPLWRQFVADPRQVTYSVGWRFNDNVLAKNTIPISFGNYFPMYRWFCAWPYGGDIELGIEGAVWAVFAPLKDDSPLIDADYYVGFPLVYAFDDWQFRLRGYHISTHLGDEFLINNPGFDRKNPSAEYIDFFGSYYFADQIRVYAGLGFIVHQDNSFRSKRFFQAFGVEVRALGYGYTDYKQKLMGHPYMAVHVRGSRDFKKHVDQTYVLGYEWVKLCGLEKATRFFLEYHDGYSVDGQFCHSPTSWFAMRLSYGF